MIVFLNGQFVPEEQAVVSVFDRSFLYGDGLFETMRIRNGKPFRWEQHLERLTQGGKFLRIQMPFTENALRAFVTELAIHNQMPEALLRLSLSRGVGRRGYSPKGAEHPSVVMSLHPAPKDDVRALWRLVTSSFRLPANEPLAQFKTCNKLPQVVARAEADAAGADEALLLNTEGHIVEASSSNLFWIEKDTICTAPLASGILPGVTRTVVLEICKNLGLATRQIAISPGELQRADGVFLSLSSVGIAEAVALDGQSLRQSPLVDRIRGAYAKLLSDFGSV